MEDEKIKQPSRIGNAIKSAIAITSIAGLGFATGYFLKDISTPKTKFEITKQSGIEFIIHDEQRYPIKTVNGRISIGDTDYQLESVKDSVLGEENKETYLKDMVMFGLENTEKLGYDTITAIVNRTETDLYNNPSTANRLMIGLLEKMEPSDYSQESKQLITEEFKEFGEDNPKIYNDMGERFKAYSRHEVVNDFIDQLKKDGKKIAEDVKSSDTYKTIKDTASEALDTTKKFIDKNIIESYHKIKDKILGD